MSDNNEPEIPFGELIEPKRNGLDIIDDVPSPNLWYLEMEVDRKGESFDLTPEIMDQLHKAGRSDATFSKRNGTVFAQFSIQTWNYDQAIIIARKRIFDAGFEPGPCSQIADINFDQQYIYPSSLHSFTNPERCQDGVSIRFVPNGEKFGIVKEWSNAFVHVLATARQFEKYKKLRDDNIEEGTQILEFYDEWIIKTETPDLGPQPPASYLK